MSHSIRVLIVEDSEDDATLTLRELRKAGYSVDHQRVQTAEQMLDALREGWDVVIADYSMPGFSGVEALHLLRERDPDTPFIFVSGTIGEETAVEAMKAGAQDYVVKSSLKRLVPAIEREIREAETRRARRIAEEAQRKAEEARLAATEMVRAVVNASPLPIIGLDPEGRVTLWNGAAERLFGWTEAEVLGRPIPIVPEEVRDAVERARWRILRGEAVSGIEVVRRRKDGALLDLKVFAAATYDARGRANGLVVMFEDVTTSKRLEEQLRRSQKMEAVGRLAGGIAHDFNNLLTVILGDADLLLSDIASDDPVREAVEEIRHAAERGAALTRQLLTFSRRQIVQPQVVSINDIISNMNRMLRRVIGEDIEIRLRLATDLWNVNIDPGQLEQVILNLSVNARDAMPRGGLLVLETANVQLDPEYAALHPEARPGDYVMLTVSDTGVGMTPEVKQHIFEPFFTTKEQGKGTGLGLATCYGIVRQFGGHISVYSEPGVGTTMKVYLPRAGGARTEVSSGTSELVRGTETILVVDDDVRVRRVAVRVLQSLGYRVLEAGNGPEVLALLGREGTALRVDLLLTDVVLPGMSGPELAERVRSLRQGLRVLFMSGYTEDLILQRRLLAREAAMVHKPFSPSELARKVRGVLDRAE
ncbi:MAG: hypothetical protein KatS3mg081_0138 [Gemmatimonadales bacterium]|nr:MAG: hypothetical protein KatS3mg081_0138 [Gemmatimonadales bacterium]